MNKDERLMDRPVEARREDTRFRVVALQAGTDHSKDGNPGLEANMALYERSAREAAAERPDLILFPEYAITGWSYPLSNVMNGVGESIPGDGPWYQRYVALAQEIGCPILGWLVEKEGDQYYNASFLLSREGEFLGKYRKVHANLGEQTWWGWSQGERFELLELNGIKLGISICADMWHPETVQVQSLMGADVMLHVSIADDMEGIIKVRAKDHGIPIVASIFNGGSYAADAHGNLLHKATAENAEWNLFELEPFRVFATKKHGGYIPKVGDLNTRQPHLYTPVTDPSKRPPWTEVFLDENGNKQTKEELVERFKGRYDKNDPALYHIPMVSFPAPWTSPFRVDPENPHHLINDEGERLFIVNKTAWAFFSCADPMGFLERSREQGVNVLRVALEGSPYYSVLGLEQWPWGGTRDEPDWTTFNEEFWDETERRVRLAGEHGFGLDLVLYMRLAPEAEEIERHRPYWDYTLHRLSKYANILTWEVANEYIGNEEFQDAAGAYFKSRDPYKRPVCTSDGTTDDAAWPHKPWVDLAINHSCTSSTERHGLHEWYLAVARNTRSHGKPAWCNESGREKRHRNDDPVHRRKQGWIWCNAGCFWTLHSWEGCEGIDDPEYRAPGQEFFRPMADFYKTLPFWTLNPNHTAFVVGNDGDIISVVQADPLRTRIVAYVCTPNSGESAEGATGLVRLSDGEYTVRFINPADGQVAGKETFKSSGMGSRAEIPIPNFRDDLLLDIRLAKVAERTRIEGTG